jgi:hypothetical protein
LVALEEAMTEPARRDADDRHQQQRHETPRRERDDEGDQHRDLRGEVQRAVRGMTVRPEILRVEGVE